MNKRPCIVLAKPGLDGHDKGIRLVASSMSEAGFNVYYLGLRQTVDDIIKNAKELNADYIGLSILSGTHLDVSRKMIETIKSEGLNYKLIIGGIIPKKDEEKLLSIGVTKVFPVGSKFLEINNWIIENHWKEYSQYSDNI